MRLKGGNAKKFKFLLQNSAKPKLLIWTQSFSRENSEKQTLGSLARFLEGLGDGDVAGGARWIGWEKGSERVVVR